MTDYSHRFSLVFGKNQTYFPERNNYILSIFIRRTVMNYQGF